MTTATHAAAAHPLYLARSQSIDAAVREKFHEACQPWVMDAAENYSFGAFGTGAAAAILLAKQAAAAGRASFNVLDAGAGSGDFLLDAAGAAGAAGIRFYGRGVTAGKDTAPSEVQTSQAQPEATGNDGTHAANTAATPTDDAALLVVFPLEELHKCGPQVDFVRDNVKFDLIVCSWTLRHLCDPLGTLELLSEMLFPDGGVLLGNQLFAPIAPLNDMSSFEAAVATGNEHSGGDDDGNGGKGWFKVEHDITGEQMRWEDDAIVGGYDSNIRITRIGVAAADAAHQGGRSNSDAAGSSGGKMGGVGGDDDVGSTGDVRGGVVDGRGCIGCGEADGKLLKSRREAALEHTVAQLSTKVDGLIEENAELRKAITVIAAAVGIVANTPNGNAASIDGIAGSKGPTEAAAAAAAVAPAGSHKHKHKHKHTHTLKLKLKLKLKHTLKLKLKHKHKHKHNYTWH
eukprot:gene15081-26335_t